MAKKPTEFTQTNAAGRKYTPKPAAKPARAKVATPPPAAPRVKKGTTVEDRLRGDAKTYRKNVLRGGVK